MSYQIDFKGRGDDSIIVSNERGEKIKELAFDGKRDTPIDIDGDMYLIGSIKAIVQVPDPKPFVPDAPKLDDGLPKCQGTYSIQREINGIIKADYPKTWTKEISNIRRREEIRKKLRAAGKDVMWCDAKADECACKV